MVLGAAVAAALVGVEVFFVPLKVLAALFGFTFHAGVFAGGFVEHVD